MKPKSPNFTVSELKAWLKYCPVSGRWVWKIRMGARAPKGGIAGSINDQGYLVIRFAGRLYKAHRLAWYYMIGTWPEIDIDHKDTDRANCKWENLRLATKAQTCQNRRIRCDNNAGLKGVSWHRHVRKWQSQIQIDGRKVFLGYFETRKAAHAAYVSAATEAFKQYARAA